MWQAVVVILDFLVVVASGGRKSVCWLFLLARRETHTHAHIYIYIYIYRKIGREGGGLKKLKNYNKIIFK